MKKFKYFLSLTHFQFFLHFFASQKYYWDRRFEWVGIGVTKKEQCVETCRKKCASPRLLLLLSYNDVNKASILAIKIDKKTRCCDRNSNPGLQDGRCRRIHWTMWLVAYIFSFFCFQSIIQRFSLYDRLFLKKWANPGLFLFILVFSTRYKSNIYW